MIVFHTDLDNTLIYSYKHDIGEDKRCVEIYHGREISFITQETYRLLQRLLEQKEPGKEVLIVPTTTRTIEQYQRIQLGVGVFPYALVCNGGILLVDGEEEKQWYQDSLEQIKNSKSELDKALKFLGVDTRRIFELRFIRELFVFTKCEKPQMVVADLQKILDAQIVDVFHNGVKVYVVPRALCKGRAVERFQDYIKGVSMKRTSSHSQQRLFRVIAAGDSEFDISMLEAADMGVAAPELAQRYHFSEKVKCPLTGKLYAEAMLRLVLAFSVGGHDVL